MAKITIKEVERRIKESQKIPSLYTEIYVEAYKSIPGLWNATVYGSYYFRKDKRLLVKDEFFWTGGHRTKEDSLNALLAILPIWRPTKR